MEFTWPEALTCAATALALLGACMTASDLGRRVTGWGFAAFAVGSGCWLAAAQLEQESQFGLTNLVLLALNLFGVWRWLVRRAPGGAEARQAAQQPAGRLPRRAHPGLTAAAGRRFKHGSRSGARAWTPR